MNEINQTVCCTYPDSIGKQVVSQLSSTTYFIMSIMGYKYRINSSITRY